jgi:hypothetical protein
MCEENYEILSQDRLHRSGNSNWLRFERYLHGADASCTTSTKGAFYVSTRNTAPMNCYCQVVTQ